MQHIPPEKGPRKYYLKCHDKNKKDEDTSLIDVQNNEN